MKILEVRFKNLNSLYGEWLIDLNTPDYITNGIFVLTGPTGAGKSTILDAICLALYGETPRLGKVTKSSNEIMSRQTAQCYAEVLFETKHGLYRCHWHQHRAKKDPNGKLQDPEHQIVDASNNQIIETKKSLVASTIIAKTGMDFNRFNRSILLAQGNFDTFLKASIEEKSKLLEQITGTDIYSKISIKAHELKRQAFEQLNLLKAKTDSITLLTPKDELSIKKELEQQQKEDNIYKEKLHKINSEINQAQNIIKLQNQLNSLAQVSKDLQAEIEAFKQEEQRLELALKADLIRPTYEKKQQYQKSYQTDKENLSIIKDKLDQLDSSIKELKNHHIKADKQKEQARQALEKARPLIQKVRLIDQEIKMLQESIDQQLKACDQTQNEISDVKKQLHLEQQNKINTEAQIKTIEKSLEHNKKNKLSESKIDHIELLLTQLTNIAFQIQKRTEALKSNQSNLSNLTIKEYNNQKQLTTNQVKLKEINDELLAKQKKLDKVLNQKLKREYQTEKEHLYRELSYIKKVNSLEEERQHLIDGTPCPLCGSKNHPFAKNITPKPDNVEKQITILNQLIETIDYLEDQIKQQEKFKIKIEQVINQSEQVQNEIAYEKKQLTETTLDLERELPELKESQQSIQLAISKSLDPFHLQLDHSNHESIIYQLKTKLKTQHEQEQKYQELKLEHNNISHQLIVFETKLKGLQLTLNQKREAQKNLDNKQIALIDKRKSLYADKDPNTEEAKLDKNRLDAETLEKETLETLSHQQKEFIQINLNYHTLNNQIHQQQKQVDLVSNDLNQLLKEHNFENEANFLGAIIDQKQKEQLIQQKEAIKKRKIEIEISQQNLTRQLKEEQSNYHKKPISDLYQIKEAEEGKQKELQTKIANLNYKLNENNQLKIKLQSQIKTIEAKEKEYNQFNKLYSLIGSSDGKKYRNFAQGLTFEIMLSYANHQLKEITDRYLLIHDSTKPLELSVIDNYQAGEIRTTQNLSGGESFIVSLALALGLSKMASQKVNVDSLFLDEGFGTLDEQTLEIALEALSKLQQSGKLIGIISHIPALKERINTQIDVTPTTGGKSILSGAGCKKLN